MISPDYTAFRRYLDACVDGHEESATVVERAEGPNVYILPQALYDRLKEKADAHDREHGGEQSPEDAAEEIALRELFGCRKS